jgi:hypothetical protein
MAFPVLGLFQVFVFIPIIPEMMERLQVDLNITEGEDEFIDAQLNDKCNDAYGFIYASSMFVSPLIGGFLDTTYGPRATCDYIAMMDGMTGVLFFVFNCGFFVFSENRAFHEKLAALKGMLTDDDDESQGMDHKKIDDVKGSVAASDHHGFRMGMLGGRTQASVSHYISPQRGFLNTVDSYKDSRRHKISVAKAVVVNKSGAGAVDDQWFNQSVLAKPATYASVAVHSIHKS